MTDPNIVELTPEQVVATLDEYKAEDITTIDVHDKTTSCRYMVVATGRSSTHVKALAENLVQDVKKQFGINAHHMEGKQGTEWILIDYRDIIVHVMTQAKRDYYHIEQLWSL